MLGDFPRAAALAGALALSTLGTIPTQAQTQGWTYPGTAYTSSQPWTAPYRRWSRWTPRYPPYVAPWTYSSFYSGPPARSSGLRRRFDPSGWDRDKFWPTGRGVPLAKPWLRPR